MNAYPHQLSGGIRQRVMIAMALARKPELVIADEPSTALDVTIQAQILRLIRDIQNKSNMAMLMITHDLGVIAEVADEVCVMYAGQIVERADVFTLFEKPLHPYTIGLLRARPYIVIGQEKPRRLDAIPGTVPSMIKVPPGCRFAPRCEHAKDICRTTSPPLMHMGQGHYAKCHMMSENTSAIGGVKQHMYAQGT